jgi:hypothetical protein
MSRVSLASLLIAFGLLLLLKISNLIPVGYCTAYFGLIRRFWPVLLILYGLYLLFKERKKVFSQVILWVTLFLVGLWLICLSVAENNWII